MEHSQNKTHQFDVSIGVQQQVLWLQIPVHNAPAVEIGESLHHTRCVEPCSTIVKALPATDNSYSASSCSAVHRLLILGKIIPSCPETSW